MSSVDINKVLRQIAKRAEKLEGQYIIESFVDTGTLFDAVTVRENSVIFGRRGTGKTHLLRYMAEQVKESGDLAVYIDLRNIGSNGGLYSEVDVPESQRAMTLIIDTLQAIHEHVKNEAFALPDDIDVNVTDLISGLDEFIDSASKTKITGDIKKSSEVSSSSTQTNKLSGDLKIQFDALVASGAMSQELVDALMKKETFEITGKEEFHIVYPDIARATRKINSSLGKRKLWLLIDEWAEIPLDLQPYLADVMKRAFFSHHSIIVKIGAIENRSRFQKLLSSGYTLGIELGADASSHISLDEFMVFDNDANKAKNFFINLVHRHAMAFDDNGSIPKTTKRFVSQAFTQENAASEFAMSCEGVARDALSIISECALKSERDKISIPTIRRSAKDCFIRAKKNTIESMEHASDLLNWIIDDVIKGRSAKAFMLESNKRDPLIDFLFDNRVLHIIKQGASAQDIVGKRYNVYSIDYGCYVDLLSTIYKPRGVIAEEDFDGNIIYTDVPKNDYRSIRRAILNLNDFYSNVNYRE